MYCLMEMVAVVRDKLAVMFVTHLEWIKVSIFYVPLYWNNIIMSPEGGTYSFCLCSRAA